MVSKHCRDVITSNHQLRQTLFLESIPTFEYLVTTGWKPGTTTNSGRPTRPRQIRHRLLTIAQSPRQVNPGDRLIVKAHPALHALPKSHRSPRSEQYYLPDCRTQHLFCDAIKKLPANTFLFQPPVTSIVMYHHGSKFWLDIVKVLPSAWLRDGWRSRVLASFTGKTSRSPTMSTR